MGSLFFYDSPITLNHLEISYNAALCLATGLPRWNPNPILRRESGVSSIICCLHFLTKFFLIRLLPLPEWKWWSVLQEMILLVGSPLPHLVQYSRPPQPSHLQFTVLDKGLPFQNTWTWRFCKLGSIGQIRCRTALYLRQTHQRMLIKLHLLPWTLNLGMILLS